MGEDLSAIEDLEANAGEIEDQAEKGVEINPEEAVPGDAQEAGDLRGGDREGQTDGGNIIKFEDAECREIENGIN